MDTGWVKVKRTDVQAILLADQHYSRLKHGTQGKQLGRNCRTLVFLTPDARSLWVAVWPKPEYAFHGKGDAWECSLYRNTGPDLSSDLIFGAVEETTKWWGTPPSGGYITTVDADEVRKKRDPGRCFRKAGWVPDGTSKNGLLWFRLSQRVILALTS